MKGPHPEEKLESSDWKILIDGLSTRDLSLLLPNFSPPIQIDGRHSYCWILSRNSIPSISESCLLPLNQVNEFLNAMVSLEYDIKSSSSHRNMKDELEMCWTLQHRR